VILAAVDGVGALDSAVAQLKQGLGNNWSPVTGLQFMSGRRGEFAADCAESQEQVRLYLAHLVAKQVCSDEDLGAAAARDGIDVTKLRSLVAAYRAHFR
jgi:hypothetical protein